eukprot:9216108-Alexandrium_andersonii.AAC.1
MVPRWPRRRIGIALLATAFLPLLPPTLAADVASGLARAMWIHHRREAWLVTTYVALATAAEATVAI